MASASTTATRRRQAAQQAPQPPRHAEQGFHTTLNAYASYAAQLRALARHITRIIAAFPDALRGYDPAQQWRLTQALDDYAEAIRPWATATAARMLAEVSRRDATAWRMFTAEAPLVTRQQLLSAPIEAVLRRRLDEQVSLITSLPRDAAERIHNQTLGALEHAGRYPEQVAEIQAMLQEAQPEQTQQWLFNRATLIARTETGRTASLLTQAKAEHIGSEHYVWRTARDARVRMSHRRLEGTVQRWDAPPYSDPPDIHAHPGEVFNCRCVSIPLLPGP